MVKRRFGNSEVNGATFTIHACICEGDGAPHWHEYRLVAAASTEQRSLHCVCLEVRRLSGHIDCT